MRGERATKPCANCGELLTRLVSQARGKNWYCGNECQAAHMPPPATVAKAPNPYRGQRETRPCAVCQEPLAPRYLTPKNANRPWLCLGCRDKVLHGQIEVEGVKRLQRPRTGDTIPCDQCGQPFYRPPAYIKRYGRFCKPECWHEAHRVDRIEKVCTYCGEPFSILPSEKKRLYCTQEHFFLARTTRATGRWHNGRPVIENADGYLTIYEPTHPRANKKGRVLEHRWVMEQHLGRILDTREQVDHIDQAKQNNSISNLQIMSPVQHQRKTQDDRNREIQSLRKLKGQVDEREAEVVALRARLKDAMARLRQDGVVE